MLLSKGPLAALLRNSAPSYVKRASNASNIKIGSQSSHFNSTITQNHHNRYYSSNSSNSQRKSSYFSTALFGGLSIATFATLYGSAAFAEEANKEDQDNEDQPEKIDVKKQETYKFKYVIIGGGTAGFAAVKEILARDKEAEILIISEESYEPYTRTPLSKELWKSDDPNVAKTLKYKNYMGKEEEIYYPHESDGVEERVSFAFNRSVISLDAQRRGILLDDDTLIWYEKCLIATGGDPTRLGGISKDAQDVVSTYRTVQDFKNLDSKTKGFEHVVVIGGGFLGSEMACAMAHRSKDLGSKFKVTQVYPESGIMGKNFPEYLSQYASERVQKELGVEMKPGRTTKAITKSDDGKAAIQLDNGEELKADHVIVSVGITPSIDVARSSKLELDPKNGGIVVNTELQVRSDLYAAGDVASYYDMTLGRRRVEHHDHAISSGQIAGRNMTGARETYNHLPMFWGDVSSMGYEAVGNIDNKLQTVSVWEKPSEGDYDNKDFKRGVVYYLDKEKVVGVLLFNVFGRVDDARVVIQRNRKYKEPVELQRLISLEEVEH